MAKCFCITSGCCDQGGIDVNIRTFRAHKVKDKAQLAQRALETTNCAIKEEVNAITSHLTSQTLLDNVFGLPPTPARRFWAKWTAEELPDAIDITATYSTPRRKLVQNLLSQLGNFDLSVKVLHEKAALGLQISDSPSFLNSPIFPLTEIPGQQTHSYLPHPMHPNLFWQGLQGVLTVPLRHRGGDYLIANQALCLL